MSSSTEIEFSVQASPGNGEITVLIFAAEPAASALAVHLQRLFPARVEVVSDYRRCGEALQRSEFTLVVLEESVLDADPRAADQLYSLAGGAVVMGVNFGLAGAERIVRGIGPALRRKERIEAAARAAAGRTLQTELGGALTGLLLEAQLALRRAGPDVAPALHRIVDLAESLSERLRGEAVAGDANDSGSKLHHR